MTQKQKNEKPQLRMCVWVSRDEYGSYKLHVSELDTEALQKTQIKEFLPDLKPIVAAKGELLLLDLLDEAVQ